MKWLKMVKIVVEYSIKLIFIFDNFWMEDLIMILNDMVVGVLNVDVFVYEDCYVVIVKVIEVV